MPTNIDRHLHQQTLVLKFSNGSRQLVATTDRVKTRWLRSARTFCSGSSGDALNLTARDSMMTAGCLGRPNLALVDPLLQRRITNPASCAASIGFRSSLIVLLTFQIALVNDTIVQIYGSIRFSGGFGTIVS